jgi:CheY-like chemotaxis protein
VCLWLPAADEQAAPVPVAAVPELPSPSRQFKILAVDDDVLIRMNISAMLEDMGHEVWEAASGDTALEILRQHREIELLITDQAMPNMTGTELIEHVAIERPALPIILATGYGELPSALSVPIIKLSKPFDEHQLGRALAHAMETSNRNGSS